MFKSVILPAGLLSGTIIGAGVFALPFVFEKAGLITGVFYLLLFSFVFFIIHLMYSDVILKTEGAHRFVGYAQIYLGKLGEMVAIVTTFAGMIFTLVAYLILSVSFINLIILDVSDILKLLFFWVIGSLAIFININRLAIFELIITALIATIVFIILFYGAPSFLEGVSKIELFNINYIFLPYGAVLFSLSGRVAIPALIGYLKKNNLPIEKIAPSVALGSLLPALIYLLFVISIFGIYQGVSEDAISGLLNRLPQWLLSLLGFLGIISLWSTYIVIGRDIKKSFSYDFSVPEKIAGLLAVFLPILLYFAGFKNFLSLIGVIGGVFIGLEGILIILIWKKSFEKNLGSFIFKRSYPVIRYLLIVIFALGLIYGLIYG